MRPRAKAATLLVFVTGLIAGAGPAAADPGLLGRWHLDVPGGSGQVVDDSGAAHDGTPTGSGTAPETYVTNGRFGSALRITQPSGSFDAGVLVPGDATLEPANVTVLAWVRRNGADFQNPNNSPDAFRTIVGKGAGQSACDGRESWALWTSSRTVASDPTTAGASFHVNVISGSTSTFVETPEIPAPQVWDGNWHALAGTYDGTNISVYLDGQPFGSPTAAPGPIDYSYSNHDLAFGRWQDSGCALTGFAYTGDLDEVRVYDHALTAAEIAYLQAPTATAPRTLPVPSPSCRTTKTTLANTGGVTVGLSCASTQNPVTINVTQNPQHGTLGAIDQTAQTVRYTPNPGYAGTDNFAITATDRDQTSAAVTQGLVVRAPNISVAKGILTYAGNKGSENRVTVTQVAGAFAAAAGEKTVVVTDRAASLVPGAGCIRVTDNSVMCTASKLSLDGADGADTITVDPGVTIPAQINGGAGDDTLTGGAGDDTIDGGAGDDKISGGDGDDRLLGGAGNDTLRGGAGRDQLSGGPGNDKLDGGAGEGILDGGPGNDTITATGGTDQVLCGGGRDNVRGDSRDVVAADCESARGTAAGKTVLPSRAFRAVAVAARHGLVANAAVTVGCTTLVAVKGRCAGDVSVDGGTAKRFTARVGHTARVTAAIGRRAQRRLAKSGTAPADLAVTFRLGQTKVTAHRRVVLRRPRATSR